MSGTPISTGPSTPADSLTWDEAAKLARALPPRTNLVVHKLQLSDPPPCTPTRRGLRRGCVRQFRDHQARANLHVKEFDTHWVIHVDAWNPHRHLFRHLWTDHGFKRFLGLAEARAVAVAAD